MFIAGTKIVSRRFLVMVLAFSQIFISSWCFAQGATELIEQADALRVSDRQSSMALLNKARRYALTSYENDYISYLEAFHIAMASDITRAAELIEAITVRHTEGKLALRSRATLISLYAGLKEWEKGVILVNELIKIQKNRPRDNDWYTARIGQVFFYLHLELFEDALQLVLDARSYPEAMSEVLNCRFTSYEMISKKGLSPESIDNSWLQKLKNVCDGLPPSVYTIDYLVSWTDYLNDREDYAQTVEFVESHQNIVSRLNYYHLFAALQNNYSRALFEQQRYKEAEGIVNELVTNPLLPDYLEGYLKASQLKSELAVNNHNYAEAYHWLRVVSDLRRQEQKSALTKRFAIAQAEFSLAASEREMQRLGQQNDLLEREMAVSHQRMLNTYLVVILSASLILLVLLSLYRHQKQRKILEKIANTDSLTGLANRRCFQNEVSAYLSDDTQQATCSLILLDMDNLKWINDGFGHQNGDWVLKQVSQVIMDLKTPSVLSVARIGGEEIALFLVNTSAEQAKEYANQIQQQFNLINTIGRLDGRKVSASFGVSDTRCTNRTVSALLVASDEAMYQAKKAGKKQVVVYQPASEVIT